MRFAHREDEYRQAPLRYGLIARHRQASDDSPQLPVPRGITLGVATEVREIVNARLRSDPMDPDADRVGDVGRSGRARPVDHFTRALLGQRHAFSSKGREPLKQRLELLRRPRKMPAATVWLGSRWCRLEATVGGLTPLVRWSRGSSLNAVSAD